MIFFYLVDFTSENARHSTVFPRFLF